LRADPGKHLLHYRWAAGRAGCPECAGG
jgi:hypothetical protein